MKRISIVVLILFLVVLSTGCNKGKDYVDSDGTKLFGKRTLKDGTTKIDRAELPNGKKQFDVTILPDSTYKIARVEYPDGQNQFDVTILPDNTDKIGRVETPSGNRQFDVTMLPNGTTKYGRIEHRDGEKDFDATQLSDGTVKIARVEFPDGTKQFDVTKAPDGTVRVERTAKPDGRSDQPTNESAVADSAKTTVSSFAGSTAAVALVSGTTDPKIIEAVNFLNQHSTPDDSGNSKLVSTGIRLNEGRLTNEYDYTESGKPTSHHVDSALAADLDPNSVKDAGVGYLDVDCKDQKPCATETTVGAKKYFMIGHFDVDRSNEAKQYLRQILLLEQGQSASKIDANLHEGQQFNGYQCKAGQRTVDNGEITVLLTGPFKNRSRQPMAVTVLGNADQGAEKVVKIWESVLNRQRYTGGPNKGKFMEDYWASKFTNGVQESLLELSKDAICVSCAEGYQGLRFHLGFSVPKEDDPTQLEKFGVDGTCSEIWISKQPGGSAFLPPKDGEPVQ
jgi:hypothetical protein